MLHWQICEGEEEWQASHQVSNSAAASDVEQPCLLPWRRWWPVLSVSIFLVVLGGVVGVQAQLGLTKVETELLATVNGESWLAKQSADLHRAAPQGDSQTHAANQAAQLHDLGNINEAVTEMEIVELGHDWARVLVIEQTAQSVRAYRQTRLYQYTVRGWQRMPPTSDRWGRAQQLESHYFIFHYFAQDAAAVKAAAARLDALYPVFYAALLPGSLPAEKVQVQIDPTLPAEEGGYASAHKQPLVIRSPAAMLVPAEITEDELLLQTVALALFDHLAAQAVEVLDLPLDWFAIRNAQRLWLMWDQELPLARWHKPLVQWVFANVQMADVAQNASAQPFAHNLCAYYQLWMISPMDFGVPVVCDEHPGAEEEDSWANPSAPPTLEKLAPPTSAVALATLFEYLSATYGDDKVRPTVGLLSTHQAWASLLPAVYGVSEKEVEAGWRAYLAEQYLRVQ